jgi:hypothetical protein
MRVIVSFREELPVPSESTSAGHQKFNRRSLFLWERLLDRKRARPVNLGEGPVVE